ncbi:MAG: DUF881 domain-containing protein [Acidaminococcales bacterium]|jgi:uncharacterized protein YlxW (UPF0749 family)|nr:DUF881 domain-containing protein [Acidaminococcales bacterium]
MFASKRSKLVVILISCILGFMIATQLKSVANIKAAALPYQRVEDLTEQLKRMEKERTDILLELEKLRMKTSDEVYAKELRRLNMYAGMLPMRGPGVSVTIDDSKVQSKPGDNPNLYLIHDDDLLKVINELKAAGAEALSINGQRIIATSEIRCAGPTVSVNNVRSAPPYVIKAIGDPQTMDASLKMRGGVAETLKFWGIQVQAAIEKDIVIPGYNGAFTFDYAKPAEEGKEK